MLERDITPTNPILLLFLMKGFPHGESLSVTPFVLASLGVTMVVLKREKKVINSKKGIPFAMRVESPTQTTKRHNRFYH